MQDALNKASQGRTTITVAHRLSTIKDANRIFVMGDGELIEAGTHDELLSNPDGAYARLVNAQKLREQQPADEDEGNAAPDATLGAITPGGPSASNEEKTASSLRDNASVKGSLTRGSGRSVASEVLSKRRRLDNDEQSEYGILYLFSRMGKINRDDKRIYIFGALAACRECDV